MHLIQLELGGKDPAYVGQVLAAARALADGAFTTTGSCCAVERTPFITAITLSFENISLRLCRDENCDPALAETYLGP